jgi:hypothetical protein
VVRGCSWGGPGAVLGWSSWVGHLLSVEEDRASSAVPLGAPGESTEDSGRVQGGFGEDSRSIQVVVLRKSSGNTRVLLGYSWGGPGLVVLGWSSSERGGGSRIIRRPPGGTWGSNGGFREGSGRIRARFMEYSGGVLRTSSGGTRVVLGWSWGGPGLVVLGWSSSGRGGGSRIIRRSPGVTRGSNGGFRVGSGRTHGVFRGWS